MESTDKQYRRFFIKNELTDFNTYLGAINKHYLKGNKIKKSETERVYWECKSQKIRPITKFPVKITYTWFSKNLKKDIDNVAFAKKFINDGIVLAGLLPNDGRKYINSFEDKFEISIEEPGVLVELSTVQSLTN